MAICGNNCMGFFNAVDGIKMSGNPPPLPEAKGVVGLVSHSGSTWSGLIGNQRDLAFNYAISAGQEIATGMAEYIEFLLDQPETRVIACILETIRDPERFIAALEHADRRGIPVVALKLGRTERGRRFALAHSGALAGSDHAYGAVFERHNVIRVHTPDELTDMVELLRSPRRPPPGAIGIVTDSGGERELITDLATDLAAPLAEVTPSTSARLTEILDPGMQPQNPVDAYGDGRMLMQECLEALADDPGVGIVALATNLVHGRPYARQSSTAIERAFDATDKPALVFGNIHSTVSREEATRLRAHGVPVLMGTVTALTAMRNLIAWQRRREQPRLIPPPTRNDPARPRPRIMRRAPRRARLPAPPGARPARPVRHPLRTLRLHQHRIRNDRSRRRASASPSCSRRPHPTSCTRPKPAASPSASPTRTPSPQPTAASPPPAARTCKCRRKPPTASKSCSA